MQKINLYIDCQFFQTPVWDRGMGRYAMSLLKALYKTAPDVNYCLIFSKKMLLNQEVKNAINQNFPNAQLAMLDLDIAIKNYSTPANANKKLLNDFISKNKQPDTRDIFMIPCLFQEPTASVYPDSAEKWLVYYDAIPILYYKRYLYAINYENYLQRHKPLFEADVIFTISKTVANDLALYYGLQNGPGRKIININGACIDDMFAKSQKPQVEIPKDFILFPTSNDVRKNNEAAIKAFNQFCSLADKKYKLVVTSTYDKGTKAVLDKLSDKTIFTGNLTDAQLTWLYKNAAAVLFTSEYEGLGLPVLEAVMTDNKVVCSAIPVFKEISEDAFYYCDPLNIGDIAHALKRAVQAEDWDKKHQQYDRINKRYTWEETAKIVKQQLDSPKIIEQKTPKPRIAILAPVANGYSAVGKVVQEIHAAISQYFDIDYYLENRKKDIPVSIRPNFLEHVAPVYEAAFFNAGLYSRYDAVIYHIGNSEYHFNAIISALHLPGVTILHDTVLRDAYDEMAYLGYIYHSRHSAELKLDQLTQAKQTACLTSLINNQLAEITHSAYAKKAVESALLTKGIGVTTASLPVAMPSYNVESGKNQNHLHIGLAGILSKRKGLDIIKSIVLDPKLQDKVVVHVFGFSMVYPEVLEELELMKNVRLETNLSDLEYQTQLSQLDVLINYRESYKGETSLTVLEAMRFGCVAIVNGNLGWFAELPDNAVVKISSQDEVISAIHNLVNNTKLLKEIGDNARKYTLNNSSPDQYAKLLLAVVSRVDKNSLNAKKAAALKQAKDANEALEAIKKPKTES